ncbi:MAG: RNA polymerase factor sigma-54 [Gudongella sp.]|jgi:RNA polymerase sigma-54 factor|nr:RNA polymerase factor sigma-54 [Gudongella sp.]
MRLNYDLTLEQSQKLIMTPELRQAIQLLQYSSLELKEYLSKEMEENPLLELEKTDDNTQTIENLKEDKDIDFKEFLESFDDISYRSEIDRSKEDFSYENYVSYTPTLKDYLIEQLNLVTIGAREYKIAENIINNINDVGYLSVPISEIASYLSVAVEEVEMMLTVIQSFDPLGVGARDLRECLCLQVKDIKDKNLVKIIELYLEDIASNKLSRISKNLDLNIKTVQDYADTIKSLEPKPGRTFRSDGEDIRYIIPDATIEEIDGEYVVTINEVSGPRLNINEYYKNLILTTTDEKTSEFLQEKFNSAIWVIRSIEQRRQTLSKVINSILKYQKEFFKHGEQVLVPLTLKEVATDIDMHESTISRATNGKYVQTPRGVFELKYFFTTGLTGAEGEVSATCVKAVIKSIIAEEDSKKPLSDQQIAGMMESRGVEISRRTVAKYRDEMNIPSSTVRRRY